MMTDEEIKTGNRLIAESMGYIYYHKGIIMDVGDSYKDFQEKEVFSKVPIESVDHPDQCYFKDIPNPDYGKEGKTQWRSDWEKLNWATLNCYNYIIDLKYHEDWNSLMEAWKIFWDKNKRCYIDNIHKIKEVFDKMETALFSVDIEYTFRTLVDGIKINNDEKNTTNEQN